VSVPGSVAPLNPRAQVGAKSQASPHANNFDLIRLAAALQVLYVHCASHFDTLGRDRALSTLIALFPGVPVFFFISGFLLSKSFERNSNWREYAWNRALRIYPALLVCFLLSLIAFWQCGFFAGRQVPGGQFVAWVIAQLTIGQFYNPAFISHAPMRALNGSVWTISVELQFYLLLPLLYRLPGFAGAPRRANFILVAMIAVFLLASRLWPWTDPGLGGALAPQIPATLFVPWFYMFLVGVLFQRNSQFLKRWLAGRFRYVFITYCALAFVAVRELHWTLMDAPQPVLFLGLALVTYAAAFSTPRLSERLLRRNDLSYGLYLYHAPVISVLLLTGFPDGHAALWAVLATSIALAYASWILIEKPAMAFKRHPLYTHQPAGA